DGTALYATLPPTLPTDTLQRALTGEGQPRMVLVQDSLGARYLLAAGLAVLPDGAVALVHGQPLQAVWAARAARQRTALAAGAVAAAGGRRPGRPAAAPPGGRGGAAGGGGGGRRAAAPAAGPGVGPAGAAEPARRLGSSSPVRSAVRRRRAGQSERQL